MQNFKNKFRTNILKKHDSKIKSADTSFKHSISNEGFKSPIQSKKNFFKVRKQKTIDFCLIKNKLTLTDEAFMNIL